MTSIHAPASRPEQTNRPVSARSGASMGARQLLLESMPVTERRVQLAGVSTAVLEGGDGPPIVLLHGPSAYAAHWMQVIPGLVATHRVIAPDLPGHGASGVLEGSLDSERVVAWLDELIERTCSSAPTLVGQTLGGAIAARFAGPHSRRLTRLVLIDSFGLSQFQPAPEFATALTQFLATPTEITHRSLWRYCAFDLDGLQRRMGERWSPFEEYNLDRARAPDVQAALSDLLEHVGAPPIAAADLARISIPTTLIWGRHDLATPVSVAQEASARYGWPLHVIENAGDDPPVERPEAVVRALLAAMAGDSPLNRENRHDD